MNNPRISIVCPTKNVEKTIEQTIKSLQEQKFQDWELLIMDGGSTDDTENLVASFQDHRIAFHSSEDENSWEAADKGLTDGAGGLGDTGRLVQVEVAQADQQIDAQRLGVVEESAVTCVNTAVKE